MILTPSNTLLVLFEYGPRGTKKPIEPEMRKFLLERFDGAKAVSMVSSPLIVARNRAVRDYCLTAEPGIERVLFCDNDVKPTDRTAEFLDIDADVVACQHGDPSRWTVPGAFHQTLWHASIDALRKIPPPWFDFEYAQDGCDLVRCSCMFFRNKALGCGITFKSGGWCDHAASNSWCG